MSLDDRPNSWPQPQLAGSPVVLAVQVPPPHWNIDDEPPIQKSLMLKPNMPPYCEVPAGRVQPRLPSHRRHCPVPPPESVHMLPPSPAALYAPGASPHTV